MLENLSTNIQPSRFQADYIRYHKYIFSFGGICIQPRRGLKLLPLPLGNGDKKREINLNVYLFLSLFLPSEGKLLFTVA